LYGGVRLCAANAPLFNPHPPSHPSGCSEKKAAEVFRRMVEVVNHCHEVR
jgi:hypothetical protein